MTSTTVSSIGGLTIITQVIPQDEKGSVPLQTTPTSLPTPPTTTAAPPPAPVTKTNSMTAMFLRAEPQALGVVQIFIGVLCVLNGFTAILSPVLLVHAPLCTGVFFVVFGSLAVASKRRTSFKWVLVTLVSSLCSVVLSLVGVVYVCWLLADWRLSDQLCGVFPPSDRSGPEDMWTVCHRRLQKLDLLGFGLRGVLLVLLSLQLCLSLTLCVFCGKAISRRHRDDTIKVMGNTDNVLSSAMSEYDSSAALLDSADEET